MSRSDHNGTRFDRQVGGVRVNGVLHRVARKSAMHDTRKVSIASALAEMAEIAEEYGMSVSPQMTDEYGMSYTVQ